MKISGWLYIIGLVAIGYWFYGLLSGSGNVITPDDLGGQWPLTVDEAKAICPRTGVAAIEVDGAKYGLNGIARNYGESHQWRDINDIWKAGESAPRANLTELISVAMERCHY